MPLPIRSIWSRITQGKDHSKKAGRPALHPKDSSKRRQASHKEGHRECGNGHKQGQVKGHKRQSYKQRPCDLVILVDEFEYVANVRAIAKFGVPQDEIE